MLTILIPTYNRESFLKRLFVSMLNQTDKKFNVLIMDDGSSDRTKELVDNWRNKLSLEYHYHDNIGKPKTLIEAMQYVKDEYVYLLDSDAILKENAVELINKDIAQFTDNSFFGGLFYCMEYPDGNIIGKKFHNPNVFTTFQEALDFDADGDKAVIIRMKFLQQVEMPIFEDEKFITESVFMNRLSNICKCICKNDVIMITDYQEDGLTSNIKNFWKLYPKGYHLFFLERINDHKLPLKKYVSSVIALIVFAFRSRIGYINTWTKVKGIKNRLIYTICLPIGGIAYLLKII